MCNAYHEYSFYLFRLIFNLFLLLRRFVYSFYFTSLPGIGYDWPVCLQRKRLDKQNKLFGFFVSFRWRVSFYFKAHFLFKFNDNVDGYVYTHPPSL